MSESHVLSALKAKRAEIAGLIDHHQRALNQARADLLHVDATLRIFGYEEDPGTIPAKRVVPASLFDRGELQRTAPARMTCPALSEAVIAQRLGDRR